MKKLKRDLKNVDELFNKITKGYSLIGQQNSSSEAIKIKNLIYKIKQQLRSYKVQGVTKKTKIKKEEELKVLASKVQAEAEVLNSLVSNETSLEGIMKKKKIQCPTCEGTGFVFCVHTDILGIEMGASKPCIQCKLPNAFKKAYGQKIGHFGKLLSKNVFEDKEDLNLFVEGPEDLLYDHLYSYLWPKFAMGYSSRVSESLPIITETELMASFDELKDPIKMKKISTMSMLDHVVLALGSWTTKHAGVRMVVERFIRERAIREKITWAIFYQKHSSWSSGCSPVWPDPAYDKGSSAIDSVNIALKDIGFEFIQMGKKSKKKEQETDTSHGGQYF